MISSNDFRKGVVIKLDGDLFSVVEYQHVKPARGNAFVRTKLKNVKKGSIVDRTFRGGEKLEDVRLENRPMQYQYSDGEQLVFMDTETYDEESIPKSAVGNFIKYIKEGDVIDIALYEGQPISVEPPQTVVLKVVYAEPGVKGDTATNVLKPVKVETGAEVKVPLFINEGDNIKVNTQTGDYIERVK
jgi:elongation factor P